MNKIDYQALREAAQNAKDLGGIKNYKRGEQAVAEFESLITPHIVLALLDEQERNQQYIKRRDQENEDIALTVGKLRVELEAAEKRIAELESLTVPQLPQPAVVDNDNLRADFERWMVEDEKCIVGSSDPYPAGIESRNWRAWNACRAAMLQSQDSGIKDSWMSCSERMPDDAQWCVVEAADGYYVQCWYEGQGWLGDDISLRNCDVIRWMAIPEPPEQDGE